MPVLKPRLTPKFPGERGGRTLHRNNTWSKYEHDRTLDGRRDFKGKRRRRDVPLRVRMGKTVSVRKRATARAASLKSVLHLWTKSPSCPPEESQTSPLKK